MLCRMYITVYEIVFLMYFIVYNIFYAIHNLILFFFLKSDWIHLDYYYLDFYYYYYYRNELQSCIVGLAVMKGKFRVISVDAFVEHLQLLRVPCYKKQLF